MTTLDWRGYRTELKARVGDFGKGAPDALKGYVALAAETKGSHAVYVSKPKVVADFIEKAANQK